MPSTTGSTASRWLGFAASITLTLLPAGDLCLPLVPTWYFTSPEPWVLPGSSSPSNSRKICAYDLPTVFASTFRRPRWAMPITISETPESAAAEHSASSIGIRVSAPSRLKRFWPRYLVWRKRSKASAATSRSRIRRFSSGDGSSTGRSTRACTHSFWSGSWMCMYSTPTVRAYASRSRPRISRSGRRRSSSPPPPSVPAGNSRSRSQIESPWWLMSSSGCVLGSRRPSGSRFASRWPRTRYMLMSWWTCTIFSCVVSGSSAAWSRSQRAGSYGTARLRNTSS